MLYQLMFWIIQNCFLVLVLYHRCRLNWCTNRIWMKIEQTEHVYEWSNRLCCWLLARRWLCWRTRIDKCVKCSLFTTTKFKHQWKTLQVAVLVTPFTAVDLPPLIRLKRSSRPRGDLTHSTPVGSHLRTTSSSSSTPDIAASVPVGRSTPFVNDVPHSRGATLHLNAAQSVWFYSFFVFFFVFFIFVLKKTLFILLFN